MREYTIGFSNLSESVPFCVVVRESLEAAAAKHPNLKLVIRDNAMDNARALAHARDFAELPVDLAIIFHIDERIGPTLANILFQHGIRVISIDVPIPMATYFGANNKQAGLLAGEAIATWVSTFWDGKVDKVLALTEPRVLDVVKQRVDYAVIGLTSALHISLSDVLYLDGGNTRTASAASALSVLERWHDYHRIAVIGFNDDTALGAVDAAQSLNRINDVVAVGQGANLALEEFMRPESRLIASTAYFPEQYGEHLIELALRIFGGERVPRENFISHVCLTRENFKQFAT